MYDPQQYGVVKRFAQELDRTFAHGKSPNPGITVRSDEDDWYSTPLGLKPRLQLKTGHAWHAYISDQARNLASDLGIQELFRGAKAKRGQAV